MPMKYVLLSLKVMCIGYVLHNLPAMTPYVTRATSKEFAK